MFKTNKLRYTSFIALNRSLDKDIFKDPELLTLAIYIALKVKRDIKGHKSINVGEFRITRSEIVNNTGLTEGKYKTRLKRLQDIETIKILKTTNKYTLGIWLTNDLIDLNIKKDTQENIQQVASFEYKKENNSYRYILNSSNIRDHIEKNLFLDEHHSADDYIKIIRLFIQLKGITITGDELVTPLKVIEKLFRSKRTSDQIIEFMRWLSRNRKSEDYVFANTWNMWTVFNRMTNYLAGDYSNSWKDEIEIYNPEAPNNILD